MAPRPAPHAESPGRAGPAPGRRRWATAAPTCHLALLLLVAGCRPGDRPARAGGAITQGTPDDGDPAVVALVQGAGVVCSGTLVAPRIVLTAAHCVSGGGQLPQVLFGADLGSGTRADATAAFVHPGFDAATLADDVALLLLAAPATAAPVTLATAPFDDTYIDRPVRLVGFGVIAPGDTTPPRRRQGTGRISSYTEADFRFSPDPSQTCGGDSGGPAFLADPGGEVLAGVASSGDAECVAGGRHIRVDYYVTDWIEPWIAATAEGAAGVGEPCYYDDNCASGSCVAAEDEPRVRYCSGPCDACPAGMECGEAGGAVGCRWPPPSPGALGAQCGGDADCVDGRCGRSEASGQVCTVRCFTDVPESCPAGLECRGDLARPGEESCFAPPESGCGCHVGSRSHRQWPAAVALLAAALLARARRAGRRAGVTIGLG